jgi:hypothetical protein
MLEQWHAPKRMFLEVSVSLRFSGAHGLDPILSTLLFKSHLDRAQKRAARYSVDNDVGHVCSSHLLGRLSEELQYATPSFRRVDLSAESIGAISEAIEITVFKLHEGCFWTVRNKTHLDLRH